MRPRPVVFLLLLLALALTAGCGDDPVTLIDSPVVGEWQAITIDGASLPITENVVIGEVPCTVTLRALEFSFLNTGRYAGTDDVRRSCTGQGQEADISSTFRGRWRVAGDRLFMTPESGYEEGSQFAISGATLTITHTAEDGTQSTTVLQRR